MLGPTQYLSGISADTYCSAGHLVPLRGRQIRRFLETEDPAFEAALAGHRAARRAQLAAVATAAGAVVVAGALGLAMRGSVWGFPLADLVWYFDVSMASIELLAFLLAIALGTPGCELGVWPELLARARGRPFNRTDGLACIVGIHLIDRWEEGRRRQPA